MSETLPSPQALLFDMDGVLADVSRSYRRSIVETAASFGVAISAADVSEAKAAGDANNDWVLTCRLLNARGCEVTLEQVTERFEAIYQGSEGQPGLYLTESLLTSRELLSRLSARLPLGIVTGRPRGDAERFLKHFEIGAYFREMVCMEDAPAKPDPKPVRLLMEHLEVDVAWLVGDTPDDMLAATRAGIVALGFVAPGDDVERASTALNESGAVRILERLEEIEELLR